MLVATFFEKLRSRVGGWKLSAKSARRAVAFSLGLLLLLVGVELALGAGARAFVAMQFTQNQEDLAEGQVRILCIGESTTGVAGNPAGTMLDPAHAYPAKLEAVLNGRNDGRSYRVLNLGVMGGTTETILELLPRAIEEGDPHIIIAMMGIKDGDTRGSSRGWVFWLPAWVRKLNMVKLADWLLEDLRLRRGAVRIDIERASEIPSSMQGFEARPRRFAMEFDLFLNDTPETRAGLDAVEVGIYYWYIGQLEKAETVLRKSIDEVGYGYNVLARVLATSGRIDEVVTLLNEAMEADPKEALYAVVLAEILNESGYPKRALQVVNQRLPTLGDGDLEAYSASRLNLAKADAERLMGQPNLALNTLKELKAARRTEAMKPAVDGIKLLEEVAYGRVYMELKDWSSAEKKLTSAIGKEPKRHSSVYALSQVYRAQGRYAEEEALRRELLVDEGRMAEYFELAKLFRLTGHTDQVPSLLAAAVERIPSLKDSHEALYEMAARKGIHLIVMQYPSFSLDLLQQYAPSAPGVTFIDNERVFDRDPVAYWYQPSFPNSFSHYTYEGSKVLASHVSETVVQVVEDLGM